MHVYIIKINIMLYLKQFAVIQNYTTIFTLNIGISSPFTILPLKIEQESKMAL